MEADEVIISTGNMTQTGADFLQAMSARQGEGNAVTRPCDASFSRQ